jgi:hypothetical protein
MLTRRRERWEQEGHDLVTLRRWWWVVGQGWRDCIKRCLGTVEVPAHTCPKKCLEFSLCTWQAFENLCDFLVALLPDVDPRLFLPWANTCLTDMVAASMQR